MEARSHSDQQDPKNNLDYNQRYPLSPAQKLKKFLNYLSQDGNSEAAKILKENPDIELLPPEKLQELLQKYKIESMPNSEVENVLRAGSLDDTAAQQKISEQAMIAEAEFQKLLTMKSEFTRLGKRLDTMHTAFAEMQKIPDLPPYFLQLTQSKIYEFLSKFQQRIKKIGIEGQASKDIFSHFSKISKSFENYSTADSTITDDMPFFKKNKLKNQAETQRRKLLRQMKLVVSYSEIRNAKEAPEDGGKDGKGNPGKGNTGTQNSATL